MSVPTVAGDPASDFDKVTLPMPPQDGFTADDLDRIPDLPPHTELIDGSLVLVSPQKRFRMLMLKLLEQQMDSQVPPGLTVYREFTLRLGERQRPEPDLMLARDQETDGPDDTWVGPEPVLLAVEIVSPESHLRDHERKPELYARAGIPHFWLVEQEEYGAAVHVYELDRLSGRYAPAGVHRDRVKVAAPGHLDIDLTRTR